MSTPADLHRLFESLWLGRRFPEGLAVAHEALKLARETQPRHPALIQALLDAAMAEQATGSKEAAQSLQDEAALLSSDLDANARRFPDELSSSDWQLYQAERQWALLGDCDSVRQLFREARRVREAHLGMDHVEVAVALTRQAEFDWVSGRLSEAETHFARAVTIFEMPGNPRGSDYVRSLEGFAQSLSGLGRHAEADPLYDKAIQSAGSDRRVLYFLLLHKAEGLVHLGRAEEAQGFRARADALLPKNNPGESGYNPSVG